MKKPNKIKRIQHKLGDRHFLTDAKNQVSVECQVRYINQGLAWLFPIHDDEDHPLVARHIAFARMDDKGEVIYL